LGRKGKKKKKKKKRPLLSGLWDDVKVGYFNFVSGFDIWRKHWWLVAL
jgi:hypothetical protein